MNCKPNDLAIVVKSEITDNIGRIVHIDGPYTPAHDGAFRWEVSSVGLPMLGCNRKGDIIHTPIGCIEDSFLRPISGVPVEDEVTDDLKVPA